MAKNKFSPTVTFSVRGVNAGTVTIIDKLATKEGKSRNAYINDLLDNIARDSAYNPYNRDQAVLALNKIAPILEANTAAFEDFCKFYSDLKEVMNEGSDAE